ncbi:MAG TPA: PA0069 family radical SAM protein [Gammaproteobacteria bacterium]|nr:PA0069 family radical SAM protein [Gammaproteobacteria bacterium]
MPTRDPRHGPLTGRGALSNPDGRFEERRHERFDDGWGTAEEVPPPLATELRPEPGRTLITRHDSPDIPSSQSINPYRGCEHGCIYCYARPSHAYVNLSPGLDFETKIFYKAEAAARLEAQLRRKGYVCEPITIGANTDPYQPAERKLRVTRSILETLRRFHHPCALITKSTLVARDLDILAEMARERLVQVMVSITSLDPAVKRTLEPRAASPAARLKTIQLLAEAGVPVGVMVAPVIPVITDWEMERILAAAAQAGAVRAGYVLLRLPYEVKDLFREWLAAHAPLKAAHVMSLIRQARGGKDYDARFGARMRGRGEYADLLARRFALACRRHGLNRTVPLLDTTRFRVPPEDTPQGDLFERHTSS